MVNYKSILIDLICAIHNDEGQRINNAGLQAAYDEATRLIAKTYQRPNGKAKPDPKMQAALYI